MPNDDESCYFRFLAPDLLRVREEGGAMSAGLGSLAGARSWEPGFRKSEMWLRERFAVDLSDCFFAFFACISFANFFAA